MSASAAKKRRVLIVAHIARRDGHTCGGHQLLGGVLQPHRRDAGGTRSDPDQPRIDHGLSERGVLRQKPVTRMNRLGPGAERSGKVIIATRCP